MRNRLSSLHPVGLKPWKRSILSIKPSLFSLFLAFIVTFALMTLPVSAEVLKIGVVGPFTGPAAKTGTEIKGAVSMALEAAGAKVGPYDIEVVWIDSQSDPAKATNAYAEACEKEGIQMGVGNWHSSVAIACMDMAAQYQVPHVFGMGASNVVNEKWHSDPDKYSYWSCKGWPVPAKLMKGYTTAIQAAIDEGKFKPKTKKAAVFGEDTDWGRSAAGAMKENLAAGGWDVVYEDYFDIKQTDFYPMLSKYKSAGVSVISGTSTAPASFSALIKQTREVGLKVAIMADGLGWVGNWYQMTGKASNNVLDMIPQLTTPKAQQWAKTFEEKNNAKPSPSAAGLLTDYTGFAVKILKYTFEKHGELNKEKIHQVIVEDVNTGKLTYSKADGAMIMNEYKYTAESKPDPVLGPEHFFFPVIQYKNGKGQIVYPAEWKQKEFEF